jgi:hypothetical protein
MINFIRQATWIANLFRIKQNIKFYGFLVFWVAYNEIFIGNLSRRGISEFLFAATHYTHCNNILISNFENN